MGMVYGSIVLLHSFSSWYEEKGFCANLGADTILFKVGQLLAQRPSWIFHITFSLVATKDFFLGWNQSRCVFRCLIVLMCCLKEHLLDKRMLLYIWWEWEGISPNGPAGSTSALGFLDGRGVERTFLFGFIWVLHMWRTVKIKPHIKCTLPTSRPAQPIL